MATAHDTVVTFPKSLVLVGGPRRWLNDKTAAPVVELGVHPSPFRVNNKSTNWRRLASAWVADATGTARASRTVEDTTSVSGSTRRALGRTCRRTLRVGYGDCNIHLLAFFCLLVGSITSILS